MSSPAAQGSHLRGAAEGPGVPLAGKRSGKRGRDTLVRVAQLCRPGTLPSRESAPSLLPRTAPGTEQSAQSPAGTTEANRDPRLFPWNPCVSPCTPQGSLQPHLPQVGALGRCPQLEPARGARGAVGGGRGHLPAAPLLQGQVLGGWDPRVPLRRSRLSVALQELQQNQPRVGSRLCRAEKCRPGAAHPESSPAGSTFRPSKDCSFCPPHKFRSIPVLGASDGRERMARDHSQ